MFKIIKSLIKIFFYKRQIKKIKREIKGQETFNNYIGEKTDPSKTIEDVYRSIR